MKLSKKLIVVKLFWIHYTSLTSSPLGAELTSIGLLTIAEQMRQCQMFSVRSVNWFIVKAYQILFSSISILYAMSEFNEVVIACLTFFFVSNLQLTRSKWINLYSGQVCIAK